ncbi:MAG: glutamyl-tRNA reductase [Andreesenia angusta]|nr:glutamyl-tRNA reductase [Andreesenia angusta]
MIQSIGVDHRLPIDIREKFSIVNKRIERYLDILNEIAEESVILSTCNRTEIYFISDEKSEDIRDNIFEIMNWDKSLKRYSFYKGEDETIEHLMRLVCGFDSLIKGEDQILSQVKKAYEKSLNNGSLSSEFSRLFKKVIACGKEFRKSTELYKIPISYSSISVKESIKRNCKRFMIIGYGEVGKLSFKYLLATNFEKLYIVAREECEIDYFDEKVEFINFKERENYYNDIDCIISATSAPHTVIKRNEDLKDKLIFDLAVPRDVDDNVYDIEGIEVFNIDRLDKMDHENQIKREEIMENYYYILEKYIEEFNNWKSTKDLIPYIIDIKNRKKEIVDKRHRSFVNKLETKDIIDYSYTLMDSVANAYINRAIEVLKEEYLEGNREECIRIIKKIFI